MLITGMLLRARMAVQTQAAPSGDRPAPAIPGSMEQVAIGPECEDVDPVTAPGGGGWVRGHLAERLPPLPAVGLVPQVPQSAVHAPCEHVDAVRAPGARRRTAGELAALRMPFVPRRAIPVAAPELPVGEDGEDLHLVPRPADDGRRGCQRTAQRFPVHPSLLRGPIGRVHRGSMCRCGTVADLATPMLSPAWSAGRRSSSRSASRASSRSG